jgi:GNAT superfamily N-acetyltransferase
MLQMTRDVWGGHDYLPSVWHTWLADSSGMLMAATIEGRVVGFQHAGLQPDGSGWLEGIRVDPECQGHGIGTVLLSHGIEWARQMARGAVRLSTSDLNSASNRMAERAGMTQIGTFRMVEAEAAEGFYEAEVRVGSPTQCEAVADLLAEHGRTFYTEGWTAYRLTVDRLSLLLAMGSVALVGDGGPEAVAIATFYGRRPYLRLGLLAGSSRGMSALALWVRGKAAQAALDTVRGPLHPDGVALEALGNAGYRTNFEHSMNLWELRLPG